MLRILTECKNKFCIHKFYKDNVYNKDVCPVCDRRQQTAGGRYRMDELKRKNEIYVQCKKGKWLIYQSRRPKGIFRHLIVHVTRKCVVVDFDGKPRKVSYNDIGGVHLNYPTKEEVRLAKIRLADEQVAEEESKDWIPSKDDIPELLPNEDDQDLDVKDTEKESSDYAELKIKGSADKEKFSGSASFEGFEKFTHFRNPKETVKISKSGHIVINVPGFEKNKRVVYYWKRRTSQIMLEFLTVPDQFSYKVNWKKSRAVINAKAFLKFYRIKYEETKTFKFEKKDNRIIIFLKEGFKI